MFKRMLFTLLAICWLPMQLVAAEPAADFTLKTIDGNNLRLAELRGNVVLINFWASWCAPCRKELPVFEQMHKEFGDLGVTILAVNIDEDSAKARKLLDEIDVSFPVLLDPNSDVSRLYQVAAMPTTIFVDRDGNQRLLHPGYKDGDEQKYRKAIKLLLRE
ncbi:TlpA disulfide reductase family protein [Bowmanella sp. JS7-9]|uniref:TlpA disulfide reductase family protein n=1 Tax=Pseudobowmanella zhangzhouensis TaxID=1537679 RepID=A0ABW1XHN6_9ALTE|nr:TlpA disulfide reductase family protein [Bowmanella sp. JS7-9]TBX27237.1 redoxin [Bowmanella sp. JS7-9]